MSAARAGGKVTFIARVGRDANGDRPWPFCREGIDVKRVILDANIVRGGYHSSRPGQRGQDSGGIGRENDRGGPADVRQAKWAFRRARIILQPLETPLPIVAAAIELAAACGVQVILIRPGPPAPRPAADVFIC